MISAHAACGPWPPTYGPHNAHVRPNCAIGGCPRTPGPGELRNYSNSSAYEEAEGVDPTGSVVYVERDLEYSGVVPGALDIWRLGLDDGSWQRITHFNRYPVLRVDPTVSSDGSRLVLQLSIGGDTEGQGDGILVYDFAAARAE